jgi:hypothetical protein
LPKWFFLKPNSSPPSVWVSLKYPPAPTLRFLITLLLKFLLRTFQTLDELKVLRSGISLDMSHEIWLQESKNRV